ncbi:MAG: SCO family protein [bacterium]|nr:SCO family protein [bacterium]
MATVLVAAVLTGCAGEPVELPRLSSVPEFTLVSQVGEPFDSAVELTGKVWVANFIFTTCVGPCPRMSSRMRRIQARVEDLPDVRLVSFTVDPETDTPEALAEYASKFQAKEGVWHFLTGETETLHQLNRHAFLLGDVDGSLTHSTRFVLVDRQGGVRGYYMSADSEDMERLVDHIHMLAKET